LCTGHSVHVAYGILVVENIVDMADLLILETYVYGNSISDNNDHDENDH